MLKYKKAFSGFSVDSLAKAKEFYGKTLGIAVSDSPEGGLKLNLGNNVEIYIYEKPNHVAATYTMLNFQVDNINETVAELKKMGIVFEQYENMTDKNGIARGLARHQGPDIAWFKDPAGNFLSVLQEK